MNEQRRGQGDALVWLITGSSRGFGKEIAEAALERGDVVVATARRATAIDGFAQHYGPDRILVAELDVTDADAARQVVGRAVERFGRLDVVVDNAGYANSGSIEETPEEDFRAQVETNFFGVVNVTRAALPVMRAQRSGLFLQFSSVGGRIGGTPGLGAYQAAKFAVEGFSEVLAAESAPFGVRVVIVEPGAFRTDWQGASMTKHPVGPDYETTVGAIHAMREQGDGRQPGDPTRGARVLVDLAHGDLVRAGADLPLRLPLGSDAVARVLSGEQVRLEEATAWADVSRSADFRADDADAAVGGTAA
ncbi:SDR family NAD(P)-dependent oxidoreductase [Agromyces humi]|uniref:SDR family NAD(P)-dependent oxidoreductase n=1 Tax=Agromyces humi TaxID=1766800 RepID=UPI001357716B|nr:SDR family NAD(P)-dependent oxidoreductase [Agromyces humi]